MLRRRMSGSRDAVEAKRDAESANDLGVRHDDLTVNRTRQDDDLFVRRGPVETAATTPVTPTHTETEIVDRPILVRGGLSPWAILTGAMTAFGFMLLGAAITGGIVAATGVSGNELRLSASDNALWATIAFVGVQFLAYLWGGYTAGRMARGKGMLNGLMVPIVTLAVGAIVVAIVDAMGARAAINVPYFGSAQLPVVDSMVTTTGATAGLAALVAMFIGGVLGGMLGSRWHRKLEDPSVAHPRGRRMAA